MGNEFPKKRVRSVLATAALSVAGAAIVAVALGGSPARSAPLAPCAPRVIVVDLSSAARDQQVASTAQQVVEDAAMSAIVCAQPVVAYGVAGGGEVATILTTDDVQGMAPPGPTPQIRASRLGADQRRAVDELVTRRLKTAYTHADPKVTSVAAMYEVAAQQSTSATDVIFVTTGVNDDAALDLNRPLATGAGARLAMKVTVPHVDASVLTVVGIAQVDASIPPPSPQWPEEILAFNRGLCHASGVARCRLFYAAPVSKSLDP